MEINEIVSKQSEFYSTFATFEYKFRLEQLKKLRQSIQDNQRILLDAFVADLNKCEFDAVTTEISLVYNEIDYMIKNLKRLMKPKRVSTTLLNFPSKGKIWHEPLGQILIMAPWNYPFQLAMCPLAGAIAGGNTIILKLSAYTPNVSNAIAKILSVFSDEYIAVVLGGREQNQALLDQKFDLIFFTGSKNVGQIVQVKASKHLTPVVLELGGKSPCIVSDTADVDKSAKRIVWGKFLNAGQTCIAPDYIMVHKNIYNEFLDKAKEYTQNFYYTDGKLNENFMYIVNDKHTQRLLGLIEQSKVIFGGKANGRQIEPTIIKDVEFTDAIMQEEIFGPLMPIIPYEDIDDVIRYINSKDKPLALYYFGDNKEFKKVITYTPSGGVCHNEVIMHFTEKNLPFGGVGESGMGSYHGKKSFETFTHAKSVLCKAKKMELPLKYPPYTDKKSNFVYWYLGYKK